MPTRRSVLGAIAGAPAARPAVTSEPEPLRIAIWATERAVDGGGAWCQLAELALEVRRALQEAVDDRVVVELRGAVDVSDADNSTSRTMMLWWLEHLPADDADVRLLLVPQSIQTARWELDGRAAAPETQGYSRAAMAVSEGIASRDSVWLALHEIGHALGLSHEHGGTIDGASTPMHQPAMDHLTLQYSDAAKKELRATYRT